MKLKRRADFGVFLKRDKGEGEKWVKRTRPASPEKGFKKNEILLLSHQLSSQKKGIEGDNWG